MTRVLLVTVAALTWVTLPAAFGRHDLAAQSNLTPARIVSMKADLRNLLVSQEVHYVDHDTYAARAGTEERAGIAHFEPSRGNVVRITNASDSGWTAVITNSALPAEHVTCGVFIGPPVNAPNAAVIQQGTPACWGTEVEGSGRMVTGPPGTADAILATMRSDLRMLVTSQEVHFVDFNTYASAFGTRQEKGVVAFAPTGGNKVVILNAGPAGWAAVVTNASISTSPSLCGVFVGPVKNAPNAAVIEEGVPACW
jgi:hypothetical protein